MIEKEYDKEKMGAVKAILKITILIVKILLNIRTNTVAIMKHFGIDLFKPSRKDDHETKPE